MMTDMQIEWNDTNVNTVNYMSKYQIIIIKHQLATAAYQKPPAVARNKYFSC